MKKFFIWMIAAALLAAAPQDIYAQGFLKRMKEKAENVMNNAVGKAFGEEPKQEEQPQINTTASATDKLPKLRQTTLVWDAEVVPSSAFTIEELMNELPPLPTVDQLVNPSEEARRRYYDRIVAVNLRIDELDSLWACSDEEMVAEREKMYAELVDILGLSIEEQKKLDDPATSESEKAALEDKMRKHIIGDIDTAKVNDVAASSEAKLNALNEEFQVLSKKQEAGTLTPAEQQRMMEIGGELMQIQTEMMQAVNFDKVMESTEKMTALASKYDMATQQLLQKVQQYSSNASALATRDSAVVMDCNQIADEYEADLRAIYDRIFLTEDVDSIHLLYDQAESMVKNYRQRAATIYLSGLQKRLEQTKYLYPEAEKLYGDMAASGLIPQCATRRAPLNLVRGCVDILNDAYEYFPQPEVVPYKIESLDIACFKEGDEIRVAESGFPVVFSSSTSASVEELFFSQSEILVYNNIDNKYYKIVKGKRLPDDPDKPSDFRTKKAGKVKNSQEAFYGDIPLRRGNRKAVFDKGNCLILHDGTWVYPVAAVKYEDRIEFITRDNNSAFVKCIYKL